MKEYEISSFYVKLTLSRLKIGGGWQEGGGKRRHRDAYTTAHFL